MEITVNNANGLFSEGLWKLKTCGVTSNSRNGPVVKIDEPVLITVKNPEQRVLFNEDRDPPHLFHMMEAIWICAGRRDVKFVQQFASQIGRFSDDGLVFNAGYGHRIRHHFGEDQLTGVIQKLRSDPETRQAVIQIWDSSDLNKSTLDRACNTQLVLAISNGELNLTVFNRSNDFVWGNSGANIVHFSFLLEMIARSVGVPVGKMHTMTNNLHFYTELYPHLNHLLESPPNPYDYDLYLTHNVKTYPIMDDDNHMAFLNDCEHFCNDPFEYRDFHHSFFNAVAVPMAQVSKVRKAKTGTGYEQSDAIKADDWRIATQQWIGRREEAKVK